MEGIISSVGISIGIDIHGMGCLLLIWMVLLVSGVNRYYEINGMVLFVIIICLSSVYDMFKLGRVSV